MDYTKNYFNKKNSHFIFFLFFLKGDTSACDQEVAEIVSAAEDGTIGDNVSFCHLLLYYLLFFTFHSKYK